MADASRPLLAFALATVAFTAAAAAIPDPLVGRGVGLVAAVLALWLTELFPPFAGTLLLWAGAAALLGPLDARFGLSAALVWSADPVLALFFGGFALSVAATRHGIDGWIAQAAVRLAGGKRLALLAAVMAAAATLSMWMSNIAATAMLLAALRPLLGQLSPQDPFRAALLLGIAFAADFGGMATPVGTGPNALAIAAAARWQEIGFLRWMLLATPLMAGSLALAFLLLARMHRVQGRLDLPALPARPLDRSGQAVVGIFALTVLAWLAEPLHGLPAAGVALLSAGLLFAAGLLRPADLARIDWATLLLIAGGLALGRLLQEMGLAAWVSAALADAAAPEWAIRAALVLASALLSALMSNTATAGALIPLALSLIPAPSTAVLVAIGASFGVPFAISTPPNAMVYGEGGLRSGDLAVPGLILMGAGVALVVATGPAALRWLGVP